MASEFSPPGSNARMTPAQIRKWKQDMKKAQEEAQKRIAEAEVNGEMQKEQAEVDALERQLDNL